MKQHDSGPDWLFRNIRPLHEIGGRTMKLPDPRISKLLLVAVLFLAVIGTLMFGSTMEGSHFAALLEMPVRDMKMGELIAIVMLVWVLFK